jgi:hypothetical protein
MDFNNYTTFRDSLLWLYQPEPLFAKIKLIMDISEEIIAQDRYKKLIHRLRSETLKRVLNDRSTALECARRVIKTTEELDISLETMTDEMQKAAEIILERRAKKS